MTNEQVFKKTLYINGKEFHVYNHQTLEEAQRFAAFALYDNGAIGQRQAESLVKTFLEPGAEIELGHVRITLEKVDAP